MIYNYFHYISNDMKTPDYELMDVLIAATETKNLYHAAERLQVSQALVSVKLKELEAQSRFPVFSLKGRKKVLTKYGRDLYDVAKKQSQKWQDSIENLNRSFASSQDLTLKIAGRPEALEAYLSKIQFSGCLVLENSSSAQAIEKLLAHDVDIAISYRLPNSSDIVAKKLFESTAQLIVHRQFLKGKKLNPIENKNFLIYSPCITYGDKAHLTRDWMNYCNISLDQLQIKTVSEDWRTIQHCVEEKRGYAIVPSYVKSNSKDILSWSLPESVLPKYTFYACFHKELKKIAAFQEFLNVELLK